MIVLKMIGGVDEGLKGGWGEGVYKGALDEGGGEMKSGLRHFGGGLRVHLRILFRNIV